MGLCALQRERKKSNEKKHHCAGRNALPDRLLFAQGKSEASSSDAKVLRVAMECGYAPYNWTQTTNANEAVPISGSKEFAYGYDGIMA
ncbi:hypothetical protein [Sphaerochaeta sp. UBA5849]|uniref:hypothetical protein n=1 Tax=Sphaerochaeta sp. UBA5849 TaxID=1947475 RepID=UPI0031F52D07